MSDQFTNEERAAIRRLIEKHDKSKQEVWQAFRKGQAQLVIERVERVQSDETKPEETN